MRFGHAFFEVGGNFGDDESGCCVERDDVSYRSRLTVEETAGDLGVGRSVAAIECAGRGRVDSKVGWVDGERSDR